MICLSQFCRILAAILKIGRNVIRLSRSSNLESAALNCMFLLARFEPKAMCDPMPAALHDTMSGARYDTMLGTLRDRQSGLLDFAKRCGYQF
jgi:hypothetical protein